MLSYTVDLLMWLLQPYQAKVTEVSLWSLIMAYLPVLQSSLSLAVGDADVLMHLTANCARLAAAEAWSLVPMSWGRWQEAVPPVAGDAGNLQLGFDAVVLSQCGW